MSVGSLRINVGSALLNFPKFPNFPNLSLLMRLFSPQAERLLSNNYQLKTNNSSHQFLYGVSAFGAE